MRRIFRSLQWRTGLAYAVLVCIAVAAMALVGNTGLVAALVALVASLASIGLAFLLVRLTVRSMRAVTEGARRLARGDLGHRVAPGGTDESRELASAFNAMAGALRDTVQGFSDEGGKLSAVLDTMARRRGAGPLGGTHRGDERGRGRVAGAEAGGGQGPAVHGGGAGPRPADADDHGAGESAAGAGRGGNS